MMRATRPKPLTALTTQATTDDPWRWQGRRGQSKDTVNVDWLYCPVDEFLRYLERREAQLREMKETKQ